MATNKVGIYFFSEYEPALIQRYGNSSMELEESFNEELGLKLINVLELHSDDFYEFEIIDKKLWMLSVIKYGF